MKSLIVILFFLTNFTVLLGQTAINNENFKYKFSSRKSGGQIFYLGKSHNFTINVSGKSVKPLKVKNSNLDNQHFFTVNNRTVQTSIVPIPKPLPPSFKLEKLSINQQKEILDGYVNYELDYFKNELNVNLKELKKEWKIINSKLFIVWHFKMTQEFNVDIPSTGQLYLSTVCFNQILVINIPLIKKDDTISKILPLATQLANNLKTFRTNLK